MSINVKGKFVLDYYILFNHHEQLVNFHDCLLVVPYSSYLLFRDMVKKSTESDLYTPFIDAIMGNTQIIDDITIEKSKQSKALCLSKKDQLYLCFTGTFINKNLKFSDETLELLDIHDYDVLNACLTFNCPLITTNEELIELIQKEELPIEVYMPEVESNELMPS